MMKSRIAIAISALTLGTALAAVPSFAQTYDQSKGPSAQRPAAQQQSRGCIHFAQGCSDKPYPMNASSNGDQKSAQTGTRENRESRSASNRERTSGARVSANERGRVNVNEHSGSARLSGSARVSERARTSDEYMRSAAPEPGGARERVAGREGVRGETYGFGEPRYYNYEPGVEVASAGGGAIAWCETRFHSFDPTTGTYMGFDGIRHPCP